VASDQHMIKRFMQELRYARKVTHENVIRIYDFITFGKSYAISMEYFPGHSLADELAPKKPLELARVVHLALAVCAGMAAAQAANVVHRDLKPANILINDRDALKIVDYGLASAAAAGDATATKSGLLVGTPTYMAPERARGKSTDSRADIYSLGVIMYEMLTGRPPYTGDDPMAILLQHVEGGAAPPNQANPSVPESLSRVVLRAMALAPEERYQSFDELRRDLEQVQGELH
jgi:serine/threonine protein kinase